jgi:hypothetical protein
MDGVEGTGELIGSGCRDMRVDCVTPRLGVTNNRQRLSRNIGTERFTLFYSDVAFSMAILSFKASASKRCIK